LKSEDLPPSKASFSCCAILRADFRIPVALEVLGLLAQVFYLGVIDLRSTSSVDKQSRSPFPHEAEPLLDPGVPKEADGSRSPYVAEKTFPRPPPPPPVIKENPKRAHYVTIFAFFFCESFFLQMGPAFSRRGDCVAARSGLMLLLSSIISRPVYCAFRGDSASSCSFCPF